MQPIQTYKLNEEISQIQMNIKQTKNYISTDNENSNKKIKSKGSGQRRERGFTIGQNKLLLIESLTKT